VNTYGRRRIVGRRRLCIGALLHALPRLRHAVEPLLSAYYGCRCLFSIRADCCFLA
jgi:hypothetical protein